jgi:uncharacterized membrane protein (UPF0127 family)
MDDATHSPPAAHSPDHEEGSETAGQSRRRRANAVTVLVIGILFLAGAGIVGLYGGEAPSPELESSVITTEDPTHRVFLENQRGQTLWVYDVWTADTPPEQYQGLSGTEALPADTGLLFIYDREAADRAIVMREMEYPIDVIFIDGSGTVTAVHSAEPEPGVPETDLTQYAGRARWILEVPHGTATRHAIVPGTSVRITGPDHPSAPQSVTSHERDL